MKKIAPFPNGRLRRRRPPSRCSPASRKRDARGFVCTSARRRASARATGCSRTRTSCGARASTSSSGSSSRTAGRTRKALVGDLEQVPLRELEYRGVDAARDGRRSRQGAAARRSPSSTSWRTPTRPGSTHQKRYEDVLDLLGAGINVISAVNIQHIESLNDAIASTTGVRVRETIPDWVLKRADEVVNVDVSIETLRERLRQGKIYDAAEDRAGAHQLLPQGQPDGAARAGAAAAGDRSGGQGAGIPRPRGPRPAGHSGEGDGGDGVARQREDAAARRLAHRRAPGVGLVCRLRRDAEGGAGTDRAAGPRRAGRQHPVRAAARREGREAEELAASPTRSSSSRSARASRT